MPAIIEYPQVVREAVNEFGDLFSLRNVSVVISPSI